MAYVTVTDFIKTYKILYPHTPDWVLNAFKSHLGGKEYFANELEIKERLDLFLAGQSIEDGSDIDIITDKYNGVDLTIQDLRMLKKLPDEIDGKIKEGVSTEIGGKLAVDLPPLVDKAVENSMGNISGVVTTEVTTQLDVAKADIEVSTDKKLTSLKKEIGTGITTAVDEAKVAVNAETDKKIKAIEFPKTDLKPLETTVDLRYEQPDFVSQLERYMNYPNMAFRKLTDTKQEVIVYNDTRHITYELFRNVDDMITQSKVYTGSVTMADKGLIKSFSSSLGTYNQFAVKPADGLTGYTTTVGASFTLPVEVTQDNAEIKLTLYRRANGGMWTFQFNGLDPVEISTYNADATITDEKLLYASVPKGSYTLTGTYKGDDPANADTAQRGWIPKTAEPFVKVNGKVLAFTTGTVLTEPSNKEFALSFKPTTGGTTFQFFPYHGIATAFKAEEPLFMDGVRELKVSSLAVGELIPIKEFTLVQHLYARHPDTGTENILEAWCNTRVSPITGMLSIDGKVKTLKPTTFTNSYVIMSTARGDVFDRVITSFKNQYIGTVEGYGNNIPMAPERDWAKSLVFLSPTNKDLAIAVRYNNIKDTLRQGATNKDTNPALITYLQNRDATLKKVYTRLYNNASVPEGHVLRFSGDYLFAVAKNAYNLLGLD